MRIELHSHNKGMDVVPSKVVKDIRECLTEINFEFKKGAAPTLRASVLSVLGQLGWSNEVRIDTASDISITSVFEGIALCLQTGNMSRFYADLLKLEYAYKNRNVNSGIFIIPSKAAARAIGDNVANYQRLVKEMTLFREIITMPIVVIGIG